jgi:hypothetical protein
LTQDLIDLGLVLHGVSSRMFFESEMIFHPARETRKQTVSASASAAVAIS